jgi:hypothetical protein
MKKTICLIALFMIANFLFPQGNSKGDFMIGFSAGPGISNFLNSEAPHKINLYGSDVIPVLFTSDDLTKTIAYTDYKTGIFEDMLTGISAGIDAGYFIQDDLSVETGMFYETKGINLNYSNTQTGYTPNGGVLKETYKTKIQNNYLTLPLQIRKYLFKSKNLFIAGGVYAGYLISSKVTFLNQKTITDENGLLTEYYFLIDNKKDTDKEYTNKFDFGLAIGAGYFKKISGRLNFKTEIQMRFGLVKIDSKYNNEFTVTPVASGTNFTSYLVRSTNYYGLNSDATNINLALTVGFGYKIGK